MSPGGKTSSLRVSRRFGRISVDCEAILAFPARQAHPRVKAHLFQIGQGGCALTTLERLFIGEECLVWCTSGGQKYFGVPGRVVWLKSIYESGHETQVVGIEFKQPIDLSTNLLVRMKSKGAPKGPP